MEAFLVAIDHKATVGITEKKEMLKVEVREALRKELVTKEQFDGLVKETREGFKLVDEKFKRLDLKLNVFWAIALAALTFANPAFVELIKRAF